ncbi:hexose-6-phosphate isomerase [Cordyceps fumosorosea ARSEF 2679]|uniref:Mannose-6-phosphate isomerase n=1 Tax=Cordyceps fumosorosea (strain ARSEF 2679) TaxID=1081104 RepID=A0A166Z2P9_CORFA|nr:hexose-6-phosphate isomerase [Cordyceps fumosorosea ARSEF 2679]OAA37490.1 hexose-6-phosphate isomerase [Cordyceps fumosorosea ARSEF 2679]
MEIHPTAFGLYGTCNNYPWGRKGTKSLAARLCAATSRDDFRVDENEHYSEMWFGDYPDFPARLRDRQDLGDMLRNNKMKLLGKHSVDKFGDQLPYLPKILSIAKALPLQVHPNKAQAARLHQQNPERFPDSNHKPEIAIALSHFELFAGWKPLDRISPLFNTPNLRRFVPSTTSWTDETLRHVVRGLLKIDSDTIQAIQEDLKVHFEQDSKSTGSQTSNYLLRVLGQLQAQYTNTDPGTLVAVLCMNYFVLEAGEAIFIPAGGVHCYISGDIFE